MRFWDSSALLPLFVQEATSGAVADAYELDADVIAWWATQVECASTLARLERDGRLSGPALTAALGRVARFAAAWHEVQPLPVIRQTAVRLLRVHDLRAADALQLAAALTASEGQPDSLPFVTLDARLAAAADREGFGIVRLREVPAGGNEVT